MNESEESTADPEFESTQEGFEAPDPQADPGFSEALKIQLAQLDPLRRLESVLFLAKEPLHSRKLSQLAGLQDGTQARTMVRDLNQEYNDAGRAFIITQVAGGFQARTRPMFSDWLKKLQSASSAIKLSGPAMETLAVVAYRQPVLKADIEAIRGVNCGELLRQLLDRGMVKIAGRSRELGNPFLYGTTRRFLEIFGLSSIEALPRGEKLRGKGMPDWSHGPTADKENSANISPSALDETDSNSQNIDDLDALANQLQEDPEEE
ncbi:MAG: SMC-Scp complex subunit ScpB [Pirellulaceae bacterium]|nr:SMC-Scp complex subunit ScpB [Pirellulaceae bacterium]